MKSRAILIMFSLGILALLLMDSISQLDITPIKNNELTNVKKHKIDEIQNIDSIKIYAKSIFDTERQNIGS
jgi:hypothetical protein